MEGRKEVQAAIAEGFCPVVDKSIDVFAVTSAPGEGRGHDRGHERGGGGAKTTSYQELIRAKERPTAHNGTV